MEENIEIPSHFLCPISLQLMRDPVTISTGITFDRDFIEKWLFSCNKTICPVTKQSLDDDVSSIITPNHTLRRLIQSWCTVHASYGVERIPTPTQPPTITQSNMSKLISDASKSPQQMRYTCLQRIRSFIVPATTHYYSSRCKNIVVTCGGLQYVADVLIEKDATRREKEEAVFILAQMDSYDQEFKSVILRNDDFANLFIHSLVGLLSSESSSNNEREAAIKVMKMLYSVADPTRLASVEHQMFALIVRVLRDKVSKEATKNALKLFVELNPWGRNRVKAVGSGAVHVLVELLLDGMLDRRISELALVVLDQLCGCAEGRADLVGHGAGLAVVSKKILRVSHLASDRAIRILSTISRYVGTPKVVGEMMEVGVVAKLCLVIQVDCSSKTKERAKEMLRLHSRVWKNSPCIPPHLISSYPTNSLDRS